MRLTKAQIDELFRGATRENISPKPPRGLSKEQLFYWKVQNDFPWFAEHFLRIRDKKGQLVPFRLNDAQIMMERLDQYCIQHKIPRRYIVLKARQMGFSTYSEAKLFHATITNQNTSSLVIAHEDRSTANLFGMTKLYYEELPEVLKPMKKYSNEKALVFENPTADDEEKRKNPGLRSAVKVQSAGAGEVGRGNTFRNVHCSEVAFFPNPEITMLGLLQAVPDMPESLVILESTANGVGDYFNSTWNLSVKTENDILPVFMAWFTDKTYSKEFYTTEQREEFIYKVNQVYRDSSGREVHTEEYELMNKHSLTYEQLFWREWAIKNKCGGDVEGFRQEYPSTPEEAFVASGRPRFSIPALRQYQAVTKEPLLIGYLREKNGHIVLEEDKNGYVAIWEKPKANQFYCIGGDVAEGKESGDYSVGVVGNYDFDIVASWYGHIDPDLFGEELVKLARYYNDAYLGVESNNHGLTTLKAIIKKEYWNVYYQKTFDKIADRVTQKLGWTTSMKTKPLMIDKLAEFIREKYLGIKWDLLVTECFTYVINDNGTTDAQLGCHDDTVMATAIMLQLLLEGKGDMFTPELPFDERAKKVGLDGDEIYYKEDYEDSHEEYAE